MYSLLPLLRLFLPLQQCPSHHNPSCHTPSDLPRPDVTSHPQEAFPEDHSPKEHRQDPRALTFSPATWTTLFRYNLWSNLTDREHVLYIFVQKPSILDKKLPHKCLGHGQTKVPCSGGEGGQCPLPLNYHPLPLENLLKGSIFSRGFEGTWETQAIMSKSLFMSVLKSW